MKYTKGDRVVAKWPGSSVFYKGVILDTGNKECKIKFEEGSEFVVDVRNVKVDDDRSSQPKIRGTPSKEKADDKSPRVARSPGRGKKTSSPGRRASPSRKTSPGRKRTASPGRKAGRSPGPKRTDSPSRRLPSSPSSRTPIGLSEDRKEDTPEKSTLRQLNDSVLKVIRDEDIRRSIERANSVLRSSVERANSAVRSLTEKSFSSLGKSPESSVSNTSTSSITLRKSTRILAVRENELRKDLTPIPESDRILRRTRELTPVGQMKTTVLENILEYREKSLEPTPKKYREFGGWLGALFWILVTPLSVLILHLYARYLRGAAPVLKAVADWKTYVDLEWSALGVGFVFLQALLALLPIGRLVEGLPDKQGRLRYRCNGFWNCLLTLTGVGALYYLGYPVTKVLDKLVPLFVAGQLLGLVVSFALFIKGGHAPVVTLNPHGNSGIKIYDFFMGREINPRVGPWDVKMTLLNAAVISTIVIDVLIILQGLKAGRAQSPTLMLAVGMQLFYYADFLWHESTLLSSFEVMYEGMGAMAVLGYAIFPFFTPLITLHVLYEKVELHSVALAVLCLFHTIGYVIYRASNNQKNEFRKNPLNPSLNHLETITTSRGRKLLASGWWGWVRHPNYLGDLLVMWTWGCTVGTSHWLPYVVPITVTLFILHRLFRNEARCHQRYNSAWELYCRRVPSRLVPKVF